MKDRSMIRFMETTPWAMVENRLDVLFAVVANHIEGKSTYLSSSEDPELMSVQDGHAVINICGTICEKLYGLDAISGGGYTTHDYARVFKEALADSQISGIILNINSPGGTVSGTKELADLIYESRGAKPIIAFASGQMCSAAYWIGSSADQMIGFPTASIGSIGVITKHQDWSKAEEEAGLKTTYVYAGKFKSAGNSSEPLTGDAKEYLQASVDDYYTLFVEDVARNLGISTDEALKLADARTHIASKAKEIGLIHGVGNLNYATQVARKQKGDKKMANETGSVVTAEQFEALQAQLTEQLALSAKQTELLTALAKDKEELAATLASEKAETARKERLSEITGKLKAAKIDDEKLAESFLSISAEAADLIMGKFTSMAGQLATLAGELTETTEGTHSTDAPDAAAAPQSIDAAVTAILAEGKITDIDEAIQEASTRFPSLFKSN